MKKLATMPLATVKTALRRGTGGALFNHGGWCVYVDTRGRRYYVVDEDDGNPVPFHQVRALSFEKQKKDHLSVVL